MRRVSFLTLLALIAAMALIGSARAQDEFIGCGDIGDPPDGAIVGSGVINGTQQADVIYGSDEPDTINGKGGNDIICGYGENDTIRGGTGHDFIEGGLGDDALYGDSGHDELIDRDGANTADGGSGNDVIQVIGPSLKGGTGDDVIIAAPVRRAVEVGVAETGSTIEGGSGSDELIGSFFDDTILGNSGNDVITGLDGSDVENGGTGYDSCDSDSLALVVDVDTYISCEEQPEVT
jgi:Ca2+-binding RTX toxin-like protein